MEFLFQQKKWISAFGGFLALMLVCTFVSRVVYASGLPKVDTKNPESAAIPHEVKAEGIVEAGRETAVTALSGLRCETVFIRTGDKTEEDTLLFSVDLEDLKEQIEEKKQSISKLQLEMAAQEQNRALASGREQEDRERAREDYEAARKSGDLAVERAREDLEQAEQALAQAREEYEAWKQEETPETPETPEASETPETPETPEASETPETPEVSETPETPETPEVPETEETSEQPEIPASSDMADSPVTSAAEGETQSSWQEKLSLLEQACETAKRALEDAEESKEQSLSEAERALEDADSSDTSADNSLEINEIDLEAQKKKLRKYQELLEAEGKVKACRTGIVTEILISPGERIPDGACVLLADLDTPLLFRALLTQEQKKYVSQGDMVSLRFSGGTLKKTADYLTESSANPGTYELIAYLEEGEGSLGENGTLTVTARSETYSCVIPLSAVLTDGNQRKYVYLLKERSGILGAELTARKVYVKVLDQNESEAALEEGSVLAGDEVITDWTKELSDGTVVRYME